jgi:hypothetical protein
MLSLQGSSQLTHSAGRLFEHFLDLQVFEPHVTLVVKLVLVLVLLVEVNERCHISSKHASDSDRT